MKRKANNVISEFDFKYVPPPRLENDKKGVAAMMFRTRWLAVVGSRDFNDQAFVFSALDAFQNYLYSHGECISEIISGEARGADYLAKLWARKQKIAYRGFPPIGNRSDPAVYHERNQRIVNSSHIVLAFWDMKSPGTKSTIKKAEQTGKHVEIIDISPERKKNPKIIADVKTKEIEK